VDGVPVNTGPSVRVTRGKATVEVPVGGSVSAVNTATSNGVGQAGQVAPVAGMTIR
jgi:pilus assembly protein CpaB